MSPRNPETNSTSACELEGLVITLTSEINGMAECIDGLLEKIKRKDQEIVMLKESNAILQQEHNAAMESCTCHQQAKNPEKPAEEESMKIEIEKKDFSVMSIEPEILKDITNGKTSSSCTKTNPNTATKYAAEWDISSALKENEEGEYKQKMKDFMKRCPYIDKLKEDSEKYKVAILLLQTLAVHFSCH